MKKVLKNIFVKNIWLKILALVFSYILWMVVANIDNPTQSRNFTASVTLINEEWLESQGKAIANKSDLNLTVTFRVRAKRSIMDTLSNSSFTAVADLQYLEDNKRVPIQITCTSGFANSVTISNQTHYLELEISENQTSTFVIDGETEGTPVDGYAVSDVTVSPNVVTVNGPEEIVSTIDHVQASIDVEGISRNINNNVTPEFYDSDGNEINTTDLDLSISNVNVSVKLQSVKSVPISVETEGTLPDGLTLDSITTDPEEVKVQGDADDLNSLTKITIPSSVIKLSDITDSMKTTVDISSYLPNGVKLADSEDSKVEVTVNLKEMTSRIFNIPTSNLTIQNLPDGMTAEFDADTVAVSISGYSDDLDSLSADNITGSVDASGLDSGAHKVKVELSLDDGLTASSATVRITLHENSSNSDSNNNTDDNSTDNSQDDSSDSQ